MWVSYLVEIEFPNVVYEYECRYACWMECWRDPCGPKGVKPGFKTSLDFMRLVKLILLLSAKV